MHWYNFYYVFCTNFLANHMELFWIKKSVGHVSKLEQPNETILCKDKCCNIPI